MSECLCWDAGKGELTGLLGWHGLKRLRIRQERKGFLTARKATMEKASQGSGQPTHCVQLADVRDSRGSQTRHDCSRMPSRAMSQSGLEEGDQRQDGQDAAQRRTGEYCQGYGNRND